MKIDQIDIIPVNIKFTEPFEISLGTTYEAENIFVKIYADGFIGYGESSPFPLILGETQKTQWKVAQLLAQGWIHKEIEPIDIRINELHQMIAGNSGIKSAFDMAIYDLNAQVQGVPLYQFLGGKSLKTLTTDMTVGMSTTRHMVSEAAKFVDLGFSTIKVKVGNNHDKDILRIKKIRNVIGEDIQLRIDANQGWTPDDALEALRSMQPYNIEHCEEPVASWNLKAQQYLNHHSPIPIMADESLFDHRDAQRLVDFKGCAQFNIKLAKSGGIHDALKILQIAWSNQIQCQVGCFSETRLGITALAHLSVANDQIIHYDMDSPRMLSEDPILGGIEYRNGKDVILNNRPGLGAEIDDQFINSNQIFTVK